ncbi:NACHT domain-containing protein [Dulcicalothrix desertica]|nr:NACHT domain-containing protein [Dulcicalothrix desertica]
MDKKRFEVVFSQLTKRRKEVLLKFLENKTDSEIAKYLQITQSTVRKHIEEICKIFGFENDFVDERRSKRRDLYALFAKFKPELLDVSIGDTKSLEELNCLNKSNTFNFKLDNLHIDLTTLFKTARLLQIDTSTVNQIKECIDKSYPVLNEINNRQEELLRLQTKEKQGNLNWIDKQKMNKIVPSLSDKDKQRLFAKHLGISENDVENFYRVAPVKKEVFIKICSILNLTWEQVVDLNFLKTLILLVPQVRSQYANKIVDLCGKLHILYCSKPIEMDDLYVDVNILNQPASYQWLDLSEIPPIYDQETHEFDRFRLGQVNQPRVDGFFAVETYDNLMVLGKPGSGKSTFLKRIALQCNEQQIQMDRVPIFINLKAFADFSKTIGTFDLFKYIIRDLDSCGIKEEIILCNLLEHGRVMLLLDGLDEVSKNNNDEVIKCIDRFYKQYFKNKYIISCRIAAHKYKFSNFRDIEIADFSKEQINIFARNWFTAIDKNIQNGIIKSQKFIEQLQLPENSQLLDIAVTPILLTLTCLAFQTKLEFPSNISTLYKRGIEALLIKWDEAKGVKRTNVYGKLSLENKIELLTYIAAKKFEISRYFFKKDEIKQDIVDYFSSLYDYNENNLATLLQDSRLVLESIEIQHGLLVERAQEIYSFSHLTFQEYFTARKVKTLINNSDSTIIKYIENFGDERWREVFSLVADMDWNFEQLQFLKKQIDEFMKNDESSELEDVILWVVNKSDLNKFETKYQPATIRAFYLSLALEMIFDASSVRNINLSLACDIDKNFEQDLQKGNTAINNLFTAKEFDLGIDLMLVEKIIFTSLGIPIKNVSLPNCRDCDSQLNQALIELENEVPNLLKSQEIEYSGEFLENLRNIAIKYRKIGYYWLFSDEKQENKLKQYYYAHKFLVKCLKNAEDNQNITVAMKRQIQQDLFLPWNKL